MSPAKVTGHKWRPVLGGLIARTGRCADRPCAYLNCRRPRAEHAEAVAS